MTDIYEDGEWLECVLDEDYEILSTFPHPIRRKTTGKIVKESFDCYGFVTIYMNRLRYRKHRVIASQFVYNDDPANNYYVLHRDGNKLNNTVNNLVWSHYSCFTHASQKCPQKFSEE